MSTMQITIVIVAAVLAVALAAGGWILWRHEALRRRFGPEYRRLAEKEGMLAAERELQGRKRRHSKLELRSLDENTKKEYQAGWTEIQMRFVDQPEQAVVAADELVTRLAAERGYPTEDYEEQLAQLSVDHARTLQQYRDAHDVYVRHQRGEAAVDELRTALVKYRALFAALLDDEPVERPSQTHEDAGRR